MDAHFVVGALTNFSVDESCDYLVEEDEFKFLVCLGSHVNMA
jgi:hypothetical protein